jgi:hypothetical protein
MAPYPTLLPAQRKCPTTALKRVQMLGALMWVAYGVLIQATPVVAANLLVFGAAGVALVRDKRNGIPDP